VHQSAAIQQKGDVMKEVTVVRKFATIALLLAFLIMLPAARADEANQATRVTFSQPVQIPGRVLPAGTYWFILPENVDDHNEVRICNADRTIFYGTVLTASATRLQARDETTFTLTEPNSSEPQAIVTWFYQGRLDGHEFLYPKQARKELAKEKQVTVTAGN
jgi:Protein of unknown function (DUF2911)